VNSSTPIADMITEMLKNCIPIEMIIVAVRSLERTVSTRHGVDETAEKRRAWDREYRRRKRGVSPDPPAIHPKTPDVGNDALSSLKEDKKHSEVVIKKQKKDRGHKLPPDWKPNQHHYDEGAKLGLDRAAVDARAERMRDWCAANANRSVTTKANWNAAFLGTWIKDSRDGYGFSSNRANRAPGPAPTRDVAVLAAMGRTLERRRAARGSDDPGRQDVREARGIGAAAEPDADGGAAVDDDQTPRHVILLAARHAGR
jgi:hypothetical protein